MEKYLTLIISKQGYKKQLSLLTV